MEVEVEEEEVEDPYTSNLLQEEVICYPIHSLQQQQQQQQQQHAILRLIQADQTETLHECCFIHHFPHDYDAIIPPQSLPDYLCLTPTTTTHNDYDNDHNENKNENENTLFVPLPLLTDTQPPCVVSYQILSPPPSPPQPPPVQSLLEEQKGLCLSQLPRQEGLFHRVNLSLSFFTDFMFGLSDLKRKRKEIEDMYFSYLFGLFG
ncbi:hypothetical protein ACSBR1_003407 [Camellia fascicularis]